MQKTFPMVILALFTIHCGGSEGGQERLCSLCNSLEGSCASGCRVADPQALCREYTEGICLRGTQCGADESDLMFCGLDCSLMNDCEILGVTAFPEMLSSCMASLPSAACLPDDPELAFAQTPECAEWEELAQSAIDDSSCR